MQVPCRSIGFFDFQPKILMLSSTDIEQITVSMIALFEFFHNIFGFRNKAVFQFWALFIVQHQTWMVDQISTICLSSFCTFPSQHEFWTRRHKHSHQHKRQALWGMTIIYLILFCTFFIPFSFHRSPLCWDFVGF